MTIDIEELTRLAVQAALNEIDAATQGATQKSTGPCGDSLAGELHAVIARALAAQAERAEPSANQPLSQNNPAGFALTPSPRPEEQGTLPLEPSRPIPPAPQYQGSMRDRYDIYVSCVEGTGQPVKTFDEWMNS